MMQSNKKITFLLGLMLLNNNFSIAETKEEIIENVKNKQNAFFSGTNLFFQTADSKAKDEWLSALNQLDNYVKKNAGGNAKLLNASISINTIGGLLANTVWFGAREVFVTKNREMYRQLEEEISESLEGYSNLQETNDELKQTHFYISAQEKNNAKNVLLEVIPLLEQSIKKMAFDFIEVSNEYKFDLNKSLVARIESTFQLEAKEELLNDFERAYTVLLNEKKQDKWDQVLFDLRLFVTNNANGNRKLLDSARLVGEVGKDLAYRIVKGHISPSFKVNYSELQKAKKTLENTTFQSEWFTSKKPKTYAKEVLLKVIDRIEEAVTLRDIYPQALFN